MTEDPDAPAPSAPGPSGAVPGILQNLLGRARVVVTPYPFGVSDADNLRIVSVNSAPGITIEIHGRQAIGGLEGKPFRYVHQPNSNRTAKTDDYTLGAGIVTNLSVFVAGGTPLIGQTFVIIQLVRAMGSVAYVMGTLLSGYVTSTQGLGWPGSAIESSIEGGGYIRTIVGTQPAAGAEIRETVPAGARWELLRVFTALQSSGTPAGRQPRLVLVSSGALTGAVDPNNALNAGSLWGITWAPNLGTFWNGNSGYATMQLMSNAILQAGDYFQTITLNLQPGDQWGAPQYVVRELIEAQ